MEKEREKVENFFFHFLWSLIISLRESDYTNTHIQINKYLNNPLLRKGCHDIVIHRHFISDIFFLSCSHVL